MSLLSVRALTKSFVTGTEEVVVLGGVDLEVEAGGAVVIAGESGSGKTTLLNLIAGFEMPNSGEIWLAGREISGLPEAELAAVRSKMLGFVFQFHYLLADFSALENVMMPAIIAGRSRKATRQRAAALLDEVGLARRLTHHPTELSGGERQRVAVARALMNDPPLLIADEPTGNLDERNSQTVEELLFDLVSRHNKTLVLVTHDRGLAERGQRRLFLAHGLLSES